MEEIYGLFYEAFRGGQQFAAVRRASLRVSSLAVASPSGFILRLDAGQCLSVGVAHREARGRFPRR